MVGAVGIELSTPLAKSLNQFTREHRFGATWGQKVRHLLHCVTLRIADDVTINSQRDPRIGMTQLSLGYRWRRAGFQKQTRMHVTKRMQAAFQNVQLFEQWPQRFLNNLVCAIEPASPIHEQEFLRMRLQRCKIRLDI